MNDNFLLKLRVKGRGFTYPYLLTILLMPYFIYMKPRGAIDGSVMFLMEAFFPIGASLVIVYSLKDIMEEDIREVLLTCPIKKVKMILLDPLQNIFVYTIYTAIFSYIISKIFPELIFIPLFLQMGYEIIFISGLTYLIIIVSKNSSISLASVGGYLCLFYFVIPSLRLNELQFINIYTLSYGILEIADLIPFVLKGVIWGGCFYILGYINFKNLS